MVSTAALAGLVFGPVARLADLAYVFEQTAASVDRLGEILDLEPDVREPDPPRPWRCRPGRARGEVEFDRVGFGYRPRRAGRLGRPPEGRAGHEGRPGRPHRLRQEHAGQPA